MFRIAVLLTCHNRRVITLECLESLHRQKFTYNISIEVFLVDDKSTDGTREAVKQKFPYVNVIEGNGNLYWCGGMRLAWNVAMKQDFDFYLWLNDDTILSANALVTLWDSVNFVEKNTGKCNGIIVGSTFNAETGTRTYGGCIQAKKKSLDFMPVVPSGSLEPCDTFNGNCVLVSREAFRELGNMSPEFTHAMGDTDYGLRAKEKNIPMWVAPKYIGKCRGNPTPLWLDNALSLRGRIRNLNNPKGLPPKEWMSFCRRHTGWRWLGNLIKVYMRVLAPNAWDRLREIFK
ncbi:MAG TPA: glycosyltransferase family 2 protein [Nitrospirota bacterium]|nr:glycosyltransferase family 2 protein [Nitrospirota bacterium]